MTGLESPPTPETRFAPETSGFAPLAMVGAVAEHWVFAPCRRLWTVLRARPKSYAVVPIGSETTDVRIEHKSGVVVDIEHDGRVVIHTPASMHLHAVGNLEITSDTHIGLVAPRIDLN